MIMTRIACLIAVSALLLLSGVTAADDTCVFATTADDIPPNISILLDNGAEMEEIAWHSSYNNAHDNTDCCWT